MLVKLFSVALTYETRDLSRELGFFNVCEIGIFGLALSVPALFCLNMSPLLSIEFFIN